MSVKKRLAAIMAALTACRFFLVPLDDVQHSNCQTMTLVRHAARIDHGASRKSFQRRTDAPWDPPLDSDWVEEKRASIAFRRYVAEDLTNGRASTFISASPFRRTVETSVLIRSLAAKTTGMGADRCAGEDVSAVQKHVTRGARRFPTRRLRPSVIDQTQAAVLTRFGISACTAQYEMRSTFPPTIVVRHGCQEPHTMYSCFLRGVRLGAFEERHFLVVTHRSAARQICAAALGRWHPACYFPLGYMDGHRLKRCGADEWAYDALLRSP